MKTIDEIIKGLPVDAENLKIKVGREIVWPRREGMPPPSQKQIKDLETALDNPEKSKGTVSIAEGKDTLYKVQKGNVSQDWPQEPQEQTSLFQAKPMQDLEISTSAGVREKQESIQSGFTDFSQKANTIEPVLEKVLPEKQSDRPIESGFKSFSDDANLISARGDISKENIAAVKLYDQLLQQHPQSEGLNRSQLLLAPVESQMKADRQVLEMAFQNKMHSHTFDRILGQGSPRIENALAVTRPVEITEPLPKPTLSPAMEYQLDLSREYYKKTQSLVLEGQPQPKALQEGAIDVASEVVSSRTAMDFESEPPPSSPVQAAVASAVSSAQASINEIVGDAKQKISKLQTVHNNLSKMSSKTKAENLKKWAQKQMPVIKEAAVKIAKEKGPVVRDWAFKNYPDIAKAAEATVNAGKSTRQFVYDTQQDPKGMALKGLSNAGEILKDAGMKAATAIEHAAKRMSPEEISKIEHAVREAIVFGTQGTSNAYSTNQFKFQVSDNNQVHVSLNNGKNTPVMEGGKVNYDVPWNALNSLQKLPERTAAIRQDIAQQKTVQEYRRDMIEV